MNPRIPSRSMLFVAATVIVTILVTFRVAVAALFGGGVAYHFEDIDAFFLPLWSECRRQLAAGLVPLWTPHAWSGLPMLGDPQVGAFYPPHWIAWSLDIEMARVYAVLVLVHALFAAAGTYALARRLSRSPEAAALAALSLGAGGYVVLEVRHVHFIETTAWLPWVAVAALAVIERVTTRRVVWLAGAIALLWTTGGVSMIFFGAWVIAALVVVEIVRRRAWRALLACALAALVGTIAALPVLLPMAAHAGWSPRAGGTTYAFASSIAWRDLGALPSLFVPNWYGRTVDGTYTGGGTQWEIAGYYAGMIPFALALWALIRSDAPRALRVVLGALFLVAIGLALGPNGPIHRFAYEHLPLAAAMRCPPRALYVFSLAVPLLAAFGLDAIPLKKLTPLVLVLVALDLLWTHRGENPASPVHDVLAAEARGFLSTRGRERFVNDVHLPHAMHNAGLLWSDDSAGGYSSLPIRRYLHLLWISNHGAVYPEPKLAHDLAAQGLWRWTSPWIDALSIRWIVAREDPDGAGDHYVKRTRAADGIDVYENTRALARAWVVHTVRAATSEAEAARLVADASLDPRAEAILEAAPLVATGESRGDRVTISLDEYGREQRYDLELDAPGVLVMAEPYYRGLSATLDGKDVPIFAANLALRGVAVPAGKHRVEVALSARVLLLGW